MVSQHQVLEAFRAQFGKEALVVRSPGRVNLIGEHTDYNGGFVLPAAITFYIYAALAPRKDGEVHIYSVDMGQGYKTRLGDLKPSGLHWPDYVLGVVDQMQKDGKMLQGFNLAFGGDIPMGAGLSSSAALECATAFGLNELFSLGYERMDLALLSQAAENDFVGMKCGLMDQFASVFGQEQKLVLLDCLTREYRYIPFENEDIRIVLLDTQVKHSLASSEYNTRRQECERGVALIAQKYPEVTSLRFATLEQLDECAKEADPVAYRRCQFIVTEIARVQAGCHDLERSDFAAFGQKMNETHQGLSRDYEVSCPELDFLAEAVSTNPAVYGARMMGGGFGGCTINLVKQEAVEALIAEVGPKYEEQFGKPMKAYVAQIGNGSQVVNL